MNTLKSEMQRRNELFKGWIDSKTLHRDDEGTWLLVYSDGATIELELDRNEDKGFIVQIGNTLEFFYTRHAAEWYLWDNWSEANHL